MKAKHLVVYKGKGIWKDAEKQLWSVDQSNPDVKSEREIEFDGDRSTFLANRPDINFMVEYGEMSVTSVTIEEATDDTTTDGATTDDADDQTKSGGITINI